MGLCGIISSFSIGPEFDETVVVDSRVVPIIRLKKN